MNKENGSTPVEYVRRLEFNFHSFFPKIFSNLYGHSSTIVNEDLYIFGGTFDGEKGSAKIFRYRLTRSSQPTELVTTFKGFPTLLINKDENFYFGRFFHSAIYYPPTNKLVIFGGIYGGVFKNDIVFFDLSKNVFSKVNGGELYSTSPTPRYGHTSCLYKDHFLMVLGGMDIYGWDCNKFFLYDLRRNGGKSDTEWKEIYFKKEIDFDRRVFHCGLLHDDYYYVFNGMDRKTGKCLNNNCSFSRVDVREKENFKVKKLFFSGDTKKHVFTKNWAFCFEYNNSIYVYGGHSSRGDRKEVLLCSKGDETWKEIEIEINFRILPFCSVNIYQNKVYFIGGKALNEEQLDEEFDDIVKLPNIFEIFPFELIHEVMQYLRYRDVNRLCNTSKSIRKILDYKWQRKYEVAKDDIYTLRNKSLHSVEHCQKLLELHENNIKNYRTFREKYIYTKKFFDAKVYKMKFRVAILGDKSSGKTSSLISYVKNRFPEEENVPNVFQCPEVLVSVSYGRNYCSMFFKDTDGVDNLEDITYCDAFIIVYSVIDRKSFRNVSEKWHRIIRKISEAPIILVANKMDLREDPIIIRRLHERGEEPIVRKEGEEMARKIKASFFNEYSAMTQMGLRESFERSILKTFEVKKRKKKCTIS